MISQRFQSYPKNAGKHAPFLALLLLLLFLFSPGMDAPVRADHHTVKIGVLAKRGPETALKKWSKTAAYLTSAIPRQIFEVVPLSFTEIHTAAKQGSVDFVLANPAFYVELEKLYGTTRIATLINRNYPDQDTIIFGGVIFARADRKDISHIKDLQGKTFMAVDPRSFGGWIMAWREFRRQGIDPLEDFGSVDFAETHDGAVYAVLNGLADAGTVRTDTLERMAADGHIRLSDFKILEQRNSEGFPFLFSTELYPEWPLAATRTTPIKLSRQVASALMAMEPDHPAAMAGRYAGWTIPLNYEPVSNCLQELRIGPYKDYGKFTLHDVLVRYKRQVILLSQVALAVIIVLFYILHLNRNIRQKKNEVDELNRTLETKVMTRTEEIHTLLAQEQYLRGIMQTMAEVSERLITAPDQKTLLQESCSRLARHGQYKFCWIGLLEGDFIKKVYKAGDPGNELPPPPYPLNDPAHPFSRSLSSRCIATNSTIVNDSRRMNGDVTPWLPAGSCSGFRGAIAIPLPAEQGDRAIGTLTVYTWREEGFEKEEIAMLEELAGDIAFALTSSRQREAVRRLELERTANYEETIFSLVNMIEHRDTYTAGHTSRVAHYCELIARELNLSGEEIRKLKKAAILHDIGKIATPDSVLLKPGKLSDLDYDLIKLHAYAGFEMLSKINMYKDLAEIIRYHHERHDGYGYPSHLQGDEIPFLARILSVADAFDAMTTNRIYKPRKGMAEALNELQELSGSQFHPEVVKAAVKVLPLVDIPSSISQLPKTVLEKRRFSYFFNDRLTGLFNEDYLQFILQTNLESREFRCFNSIHLLNLPAYNKRLGWERGNQLVIDFSDELVKAFPGTLIFRAYGNDFAIIAKKHLVIDGATLSSFASIRDTEITIEVHHVDLHQERSYTVTKQDKLEVSSDMV